MELRSGDDVATLLRPSGTPNWGIVIAHGGSDDGRHYFLDEAELYASRGAAVVLPVTRFPGHGDPAEVEASIQRSVRTHRWALDVLADEGAPRLGFYGHSAGAFLGTQLVVADDRVEALVLAGYGSGTGVRLAALDPVSPAYLEFLERYDPRHHLPRRHPCRVFVQHGRHDVPVPIAEGRAMHAAAGEDARWAEYDCDHGMITVDPAARRDRLEFFGL